jgi:hypothetical protein
MAILKFTARISRELLNYFEELRIRRNERLTASLSAIHCAEKARILAGRITDSKDK